MENIKKFIAKIAVLKFDKHLIDDRDDRGATVQTVVIVAIITLTASVFGIILWNILNRQEQNTPGERAVAIELRQKTGERAVAIGRQIK